MCNCCVFSLLVDGRNVLMDMEGKNSETILSELTAIAGKTE